LRRLPTPTPMSTRRKTKRSHQDQAQRRPTSHLAHRAQPHCLLSLSLSLPLSFSLNEPRLTVKEPYFTQVVAGLWAIPLSFIERKRERLPLSLFTCFPPLFSRIST
jgi:hypothetical protein